MTGDMISVDRLRTELSNNQSLHVRVMPGDLISFRLVTRSWSGAKYGAERVASPEELNLYYEGCGAALALVLDELQRLMPPYYHV
jgi:hypothetical protein